MLTTIKIILGIIIAIALVTALWRLFHDWLLKAIPYVFWFIVGIIIIPIGFKLMWKYSDPPDAKTKAMYQYIINQYNGKDSSNRTSNSRPPQDYPER